MPTNRDPARSGPRRRRHLVVGVVVALASLTVAPADGWTNGADRPARRTAVHVYITGADGVRRFYELETDTGRSEVDHHQRFHAVVSDLPSGGVKIDVYPIDPGTKSGDRRSALGVADVSAREVQSARQMHQGGI